MTSPQLKVIVRQLPPDLPLSVFQQTIQPWQSLISHVHYYPGKARDGRNKKPQKNTHAYIHFQSSQARTHFQTHYHNWQFKNTRGDTHHAQVECCLLQRPIQASPEDALANTLFECEAYLDFLKHPLQEAESSGAESGGVGHAEVTPLLVYRLLHRSNAVSKTNKKKKKKKKRKAQQAVESTGSLPSANKEETRQGQSIKIGGQPQSKNNGQPKDHKESKKKQNKKQKHSLKQPQAVASSQVQPQAILQPSSSAAGPSVTATVPSQASSSAAGPSQGDRASYKGRGRGHHASRGHPGRGRGRGRGGGASRPARP